MNAVRSSSESCACPCWLNGLTRAVDVVELAELRRGGVDRLLAGAAVLERARVDVEATTGSRRSAAAGSGPRGGPWPPRCRCRAGSGRCWSSRRRRRRAAAGATRRDPGHEDEQAMAGDPATHPVEDPCHPHVRRNRRADVTSAGRATTNMSGGRRATGPREAAGSRRCRVPAVAARRSEELVLPGEDRADRLVAEDVVHGVGEDPVDREHAEEVGVGRLGAGARCR